MTLIAG